MHSLMNFFGFFTGRFEPVRTLFTEWCACLEQEFGQISASPYGAKCLVRQ